MFPFPTPTVFVSSVSSGEHALSLRWELARALNAEGILTDFNQSIMSSNYEQSRAPVRLVIDEYQYAHGYICMQDRMVEVGHVVPWLHEFVRSRAP